MTRLYLIRHGEIDANRAQHWHGSTDSALNATGHRQAELMAAHLSRAVPALSAIYASPLQRTYDTAGYLAKAAEAPLIGDPRLVEYSVGVFEGRAYSWLREDGFFERMAADLDYAPEEGESVNEVCSRVTSALYDIAARHSDEDVAIVGHGAALAIAMSQMLEQKPYPFYPYHMSNTGVSELTVDASVKLVAFDQTNHLEDADTAA